MIGSLIDAREELKRVEHQIFVSLKYTRTVDVMMNIIGRMIDGYAFLIDALLKKKVEEKVLEDIPHSPLERGKLLLSLTKDDEKIAANVDLYFLLRKLIRTNPEREQEYRRHVTLRTIVEGHEEAVTIDVLTEWYYFITDFYKHVELIIMPERSD
ncbi:MAG: hypothetical protein H6502_01635 [Candidatus Woesearchaeota archaeon]|nr:MAG: hypothetical protein H6502_01635 [Candidatus Woesearchaeota archaeon]